MGIEILTALSLGATAVGGVTSAIGAAQQGKAAQEAANYQAQVAANNSALAAQQATEVRRQGQEALAEQGRKAAQRLGATRAALGAAGVDVNSGTALDVQEGTAEIGRLDQLRVWSQAVNKAFEADVQSTNYANEGTLTRMKGKSAASAGNIGVATSLLGAASNFSSKWAGFSRTGAVPSWGDE